MGKNRKQASLTNVVQYDSNFNLSIGSSTSSSFNSSGSIIAASGFTGSLSGSVFGLGDTVSFSSSVSSDLSNLESKSASVDISISNINSVTASNIARLSNLESKSSSVDISISNINSVTSSNIARLSNLESKSSSVDISVSSLNTFSASNANQSLNQLTGSLATTGSNSFYGTQVFSGSVYIANDLVVQGSSSIQYISASSVSIGTNIIQLNTANPSVRFAGLSIIDSGSVGGSGSFLYDSLQDEFIFIHRGNGTNITSSHFVLGPETYDSLGNETYLTTNILSKGTGKEHLIDSCIFDNGTTTCIKNNLVTTGTMSGTTIYGSTAVCSPIGLFSGCVGIGTVSPSVKLQVEDSSSTTLNILYLVNSSTAAVTTKQNNLSFRMIDTAGTRKNAFQLTAYADSAGGNIENGGLIFTGRKADVDTEYMRITSCGNVGIGTNSPTPRDAGALVLELYGTSSGRSSLKFTNSTSGTGATDGMWMGYDSALDFNIINNEAGAIAFGTSNTERMRITCAGTFGFNCSGVAARTMVVKGATGCYIVAEFIEPAGVHSMFLYPNKNCTNHISSDYMSGGVYLPLSLSGRECTTDLVLGINGNIGINNGNPLTMLQVSLTPNAVAKTRNTCFGSCGLIFLSGLQGTSDSEVGIFGGNDFGSLSAGIGMARANSGNWDTHLRFYTHISSTSGNPADITEKMRITGDGYVGIGTSSPVTRLTINSGGANTSTNYQFKNISVSSGFSGGYTGTAIQSLLAGYDGSSIYGTDIGYGYDGTGYALMFSTNDDTSGNPIERMRITSAGITCFGFTVCAPCFATISDYRMKSNIRPIEGLSIIMNTKPYKFEYNYDCSTSFGMIAHELQDTVPEAVFGYKDGEVMQGVDYMKLLPIAIKAIQEQQCKIALLESCIGIV